MNIEHTPSGTPKRESLSNEARLFAETIRNKSVLEAYGLCCPGTTESRIHLLDDIAAKGRDRSIRGLAGDIIAHHARMMKDQSKANDGSEKMHNPFPNEKDDLSF